MSDGSIIIDTEIDTSEARSQASGLGSSLSDTFAGIRDVMQGPIAAIGMVADGIGQVAAVVGDLAAEYADSEKAIAIMEATLKATGATAWTTSEALQNMATDLQLLTGISDEEILSAESVMLGFKNIQGVNFDEAIKAVLDMSVAMKMDLKSAAVMVGKALDDPINGVTSLQRQGFRFTDQQKAQWEQMVKVGDIAGVQSEILKELDTTYGGVAEAANALSTASGEHLKNAMSDLKEEIGGFVSGPLNDLQEGFAELISGKSLSATKAFGDLRDEFGMSSMSASEFAGKLKHVADYLKQDDAYGKLSVSWLKDYAKFMGYTTEAVAKMIIKDGDFSEQAIQSANALLEETRVTKAATSAWELGAKGNEKYSKALKITNNTKAASVAATKTIMDAEQKAYDKINSDLKRRLITESQSYTQKIAASKKIIDLIEKENEAGNISAEDAKKAIDTEIALVIKYQGKLDDLAKKEKTNSEEKKAQDEKAKKALEDLEAAVIKNKQATVDGQIEMIEAERRRLIALTSNAEEIIAINENADREIKKILDDQTDATIDSEEKKQAARIDAAKKSEEEQKKALETVKDAEIAALQAVAEMISIVSSNGSAQMKRFAATAEGTLGALVDVIKGDYLAAFISMALTFASVVYESFTSVDEALERYGQDMEDATEYVNNLGETFTGVFAEQDEALASSTEEINEYFDSMAESYQATIDDKWASSQDVAAATEQLAAIEAKRQEALAKAQAIADQDKIDALSDYSKEWADTQKTKLQLIKEELAAELKKAKEMGASAATLAAIQKYYAEQAAEAQIEATEAAAEAALSVMTENAQAMYKAQESFVESLGGLSSELAGELASNFEDGLTEADFLTTFKEKLLSMAIEGAIYAAGIADKLTELGETMAAAVADGFSEAELIDLKAKVTALYDEAESIVAPIQNLIADIFPDETTVTSSTTASDAVSAVESVASSTADSSSSVSTASSTYFTIECTVEGAAIGKVAFEYVDGIVKAAYGV